MAGRDKNPINGEPFLDSSDSVTSSMSASTASNPVGSGISPSQAASIGNGAAMAVPQTEPLLLGTYTPKIDQKGRMALPAKMRAQLGEGMVMARGQEKCVYLLPQSEFRRIAARIQRASMGNKATRSYLRVFLSAL